MSSTTYTLYTHLPTSTVFNGVEGNSFKCEKRVILVLDLNLKRIELLNICIVFMLLVPSLFTIS